MMRLSLLVMGMALALALLPAPAGAQDPLSLLVYRVWVEPGTAGGATRGYVTVENEGAETVTLTSASSPAASRITIQTDHSGGELIIEPGTRGELTPDGAYLSLENLTADLEAGMAVALNLSFQVDGVALPVSFLTAAIVQEQSPDDTLIAASAWARPTALQHVDGDDASGAVSGAYLTLINRGAEAVAVTGASADAAMIEVHETQVENDVARMRRVDRLEIPAGGRVDLEPGGLHLMLMNLTDHLVPGDAFALTLTLDSGESMTVGVPVRDEAATF